MFWTQHKEGAMPDTKRMTAENRKKLLGCVKQKNAAWLKRNKKKKVPGSVNQQHFRECSRKFGYD